MSPSRPTISGLPGRMAIFQKSSAMPVRRQRRLHEVVLADRGAADDDEDVGAGRPVDAARRSPRRRSGAMPRSIGSPPHSRTSAARPTPFDETIWSGPGSLAGRHQLVAVGEDRDARPAADGQGGMAHRRGERERARHRARGPLAGARRRR